MTAWGIYPWFREHGMDHIHPDSRDQIVQDLPNGKLFKRIEIADAKWIEIEGATGKLRVKPDLFQPVPSPPFDFGQVVRTLPPRTPRIGTVTGIQWHHEKKRPFFLLSLDGKQLSGRYWDDELEATSTNLSSGSPI